MRPVLDATAAAVPVRDTEPLRLLPGGSPEDALVDVPDPANRPTWEMPANVVSLWDPEHRDERPCEILPERQRDHRWTVVAVLSVVIIAGTVALLALVS